MSNRTFSPPQVDSALGRRPSGRARLAWMALGLLSLFAAGCGPSRIPLQQVEGEVRVGGQPAERAFVILHPVDSNPELQVIRPSGWTDAAGRFRLTTFDTEDGAPLGEYKVTLEWPAPAEDADLDSEDPESRSSGEDRLKGRYSDPATTNLQVTVQPGQRQLEPIDIP